MRSRRLVSFAPVWIALFVAPSRVSAQETVHSDELAALDHLGPRLRAAVGDMAAGDRVPIVVEFEASPPPPGASVALLRRRASAALAPLDTLLGAGGDAAAGERDESPDLAAGLQIERRFWVVPAAAGRADRAAIEALARQPGVERVYLDERFPVRLEPARSAAAPSYTTTAMRTIGADAVWPLGIVGEGTVVAIFDTGVDGDHALLSSRWRGLNTDIRASWFDPFTWSTLPADDIGHGTLVAQAAVGALEEGDTLYLETGEPIVASDGTDVVTGTAPGAEWIAARIFEFFGGVAYTRLSVILQAFEWALDPDGDGSGADAPDVINNSWGVFAEPGTIGQCAGLLYDAVDAAEAAGIAVVFAAGNFGPDPGSVSVPAARDDPDLATFAVGAVEVVDGAVNVADFSGRGPSPCNGGIKPEIVAPGRIPVIEAAGPDAARLAGFSTRGTSFASPQVAGALALLRQVDPGAPPEAMKRLLLQTANDLPPAGEDNAAGAGLLDVPAAVAVAAPAVVSAGVWQLGPARLDGDALLVTVANRGTEWTGAARLEVRAPELTSRSAAIEALAPGERTDVRFALSPAALGDSPAALRASVHGADGTVRVERTLLLAPPDPLGAFVLRDGELSVGANDFGRLGRIAAARGFQWRGIELLPAGALFVADASRISDAVYVTVLGQPELKTSSAAVDTDWAPRRALTRVDSTTADYRFDDFTALQSMGLMVDARLDVSVRGGVAALVLTASIRNAGPAPLSSLVPGLFADWDLEGGERIRWAPGPRALITEPRVPGGPLTMVAADAPALATADVPLGTPTASGTYEAGSGVLAEGEFREDTKLALARGLPTGPLPGVETATDRAALLSVDPVSIAPGATRVFRYFLLASDDQAAAAARLEELRAEPVRPPAVGGDGFRALAPFPNPLRVGSGAIRFPVALPDAGSSPRTLVFEVYDLAGRRVVQQRFPSAGAGAPPIAVWDGRLGGGEPAAAGVYLFVFRLGDEVRSGKVLLLR